VIGVALEVHDGTRIAFVLQRHFGVDDRLGGHPLPAAFDAVAMGLHNVGDNGIVASRWRLRDAKCDLA
jgi:hypothetical protein